MITLHTSAERPESKKIEERLKDLVIAFQKMEHDAEDSDLPYIEEDGKKYVSEKDIEEWLRKLEAEVSWSRSLSGDGCYIDPQDGTIC